MTTGMIYQDIKPRTLNWCKKFLSGTWSTCTVDDFEIEQIKGALSNYIYVVKLKDHILTEKHEHRSAILRLYGEISGSHEKFYEILTFNMLSERNLGPRLLGAFKHGRLEQYLESKALTVNDLRSGRFLNIVAQKMARFHLIQSPVDKRPIYISRFVRKYMPWVKKAFEGISYPLPNENPLPDTGTDSFVQNLPSSQSPHGQYHSSQSSIVASPCFLPTNENGTCSMTQRQKEIIQFMIDRNVVEEYKKLWEALKSINSAVVFCHNDVQEGNILVLQVIDPSQQNQIQIIDFEYSHYGYGAYDIGNHFCEWVMQNVSDHPMGFEYDINSYPDESQQLEFCRSYIDFILKNMTEEQLQTFSGRLTTPERLAMEANAHSLMSHLFWGFWGVAQHYLSKIDFPFLEYSYVRFQLYFHFKDKFYPKI
ncbi:Choline/ethanolamine kinase [Thelohanellus kitauei]|uniref:Choline/ethanolamine kinase n=1 Tax=Thelohanellus kitauei TaxID=669202 RepID=A0A0C2MNY1_THEKT|nr:Choline/ethanolamine kinase [Thelohanellus kitauei]